MKSILIFIMVLVSGCGVSSESWEACNKKCSKNDGAEFVGLYMSPPCTCKDGARVSP